MLFLLLKFNLAINTESILSQGPINVKIIPNSRKKKKSYVICIALEAAHKQFLGEFLNVNQCEIHVRNELCVMRSCASVLITCCVVCECMTSSPSPYLTFVTFAPPIRPQGETLDPHYRGEKTDPQTHTHTASIMQQPDCLSVFCWEILSLSWDARV